MAIHRVRQGESIVTLARRYGVSAAAIWEHAGNAELKQRRKKPSILLPGDEVTIPDDDPRSVEVPAGKMHRFRVRTATVRFEARFLAEGEPRAGWAYEAAAGGATLTGTLDAQGSLRLDVPADAEQVTVRLRPPEGHAERDPRSHVFALHHLDPLDTPSGARHRLRSLGYHADAAEDGLGPTTGAALRAFQKQHGLGATGELDAATQSKLEEVFGS